MTLVLPMNLAITSALFVSTFLLMSADAMAGGLAPPTDDRLVHKSDSHSPIGKLNWKITETSSSKVLGEGNRDLLLSDVQVIAEDDPSGYIEQRIPLSAGFYLKLNSGRNAEPFKGFGMAAGKQDITSFSWEWFVVDKLIFADKLQESGRLQFDSLKIGNFYEVTQTRFLTDISMRVLDYEGNGDPNTPAWRVEILKGSDIKWPTYTNGKVMKAEDAAAWHTAHPSKPAFWDSLVKAAKENTTATK